MKNLSPRSLVVQNQHFGGLVDKMNQLQRVCWEGEQMNNSTR
jgi:hypothetical protein